jgi:hypothetical protein
MVRHAAASGTSPLSGRTGRPAIHASTSELIHMLFPPAMRERGNFPALIHAQIVGYDDPIIASTSCFERRRSVGGGESLLWFKMGLTQLFETRPLTDLKTTF